MTLTGLAALEKTDWSQLHHAYAPAVDTPAHLRALLAEDPAGREAALSHLWSAILHQGTPWTATPPAALVIAGFLDDDRIDRGELPVRDSLLNFLVGVAEAAAADQSREELTDMAGFDRFSESQINQCFESDDEDIVNAFLARSILGCMDVCPILMEAMERGLDHASPRVRACSARGVATLAKTAPFQDRAASVQQRLIALAVAADTSDERSAHLMALGELGAAPASFLADPSPAVRMCAALASNLAENPAATEVLIQTLEAAAEIDSWFVERPPQFRMLPRFQALRQLLERVKDFDRIIDAAVAVIAITTRMLADFDWGPLLAAAFPAGNGLVQTPVQRRFLKALVEKATLWDPKFGNAQTWFKKAGLPYGREKCAELLDC